MMISVILPVYNGEMYLAESIQSILQQSYSNFELIIINDGSSDKSDFIVRSFDDPRIRYYSQANHGLAATLNTGISLARGKYIARQDQDDVSFFHRFKTQLEFLEGNADVAMVGTAAVIWQGNKKTNRVMRHPKNDCEIKFSFLFDNFFVHSSVMIKRSILLQEKGYSVDKNRQPPEDYELWSRIVRKYKVANLTQAYIAYREVAGSMSRVDKNPFVRNVLKISSENISYLLHSGNDEVIISDLTKVIHRSYSDITRENSLSDFMIFFRHLQSEFSSTYGYANSEFSRCSRKFKVKFLVNYLHFKFVIVLKLIGLGK